MEKENNKSLENNNYTFAQLWVEYLEIKYPDDYKPLVYNDTGILDYTVDYNINKNSLAIFDECKSQRR